MMDRSFACIPGLKSGWAQSLVSLCYHLSGAEGHVGGVTFTTNCYIVPFLSQPNSMYMRVPRVWDQLIVKMFSLLQPTSHFPQLRGRSSDAMSYKEIMERLACHLNHGFVWE